MRTPVRSSRPSPRQKAHAVRIIGGRWKRTPIPVADLPGLRPTPDRVRETVFNWIGHLCPDVQALRGLDLFAGTGALGFELASRGAAAVTLVERNDRALQRLHEMRTRLQAEQVTILGGDALSQTASLPRAVFDVVFLDPPYGERLLDRALAAVKPLLAEGALVYVEDRDPLDDAALAAAGFHIVRQDRAGQVNFALLAASGA
jgi:16S rRNA (guanine966-N2)-methyltransferase